MPLSDQQGLEVETHSPGDTADISANDTPTTDTDSTPQSSSGSETTTTDNDTGPASLEDAIAAALEPSTDADAATPEGETSDADADDQTDETSDKAEDTEEPPDGTVKNGSPGEDDADDLSDDEIAAMRPKAQKRVKQLLSQRNEARREVEALKGDATNYQQIRQYMTTNQLGDQEVAELFQLGADLKSGNPDRLGKFLDRVMPLVQRAMEATGRALPQDLQEQVDSGDMTEDVARNMSRTRTQAAFAEQQAQQAQRQTAQVQTSVAQAQINLAVTQWQEHIRQTDPDFDMKADAMTRVAQAMVAEKGLPKTPAEAVEYAKAAHAEVSRWMKSARPAPKPSRAAPTSQTAPRSGLAPAPTSLEAIINQAFEG